MRHRYPIRDTALLAAIGRRLRAAREQQGMTQRALSIAAGRDPSLVNHVEAGRTIGLTTLYALAGALNVSVHDLLPEVTP